ncbi:hypothetical protein H2200_009231 [Cladophialophora chaetospira]|uniref:Nucleolar protein Dnt1-like N-terminal domain-containing protein n=1 Tax=Cladophialophora chaetospira TaxID=386627 RepID=A0AA38X3U0_9EURO|nr:hypothetical protein H2200_009231 [Cladophialophora chaetospira]
MVRIRVAARVFSEDDYLKNIKLGRSIASSIKDEKRLVVIVREPYQWQIGTLLLEIKRAYESCYGRELPTVKYLKDADDFDISLRSYVSDVLLDEGRAQTDASDQRVTVNVVSEQGRRVREGSVAVGNQLEDPQFRLQLEQTSRPPVPTFPGLPSSLGKRPLQYADGTSSIPIGAKRAKHIEIPETHNEEQEQDLISSIEHDEPQGSVELVRGTQYSTLDQRNAQDQPLLVPKDESPELRRLLQNVPPATDDELEELPEQPPHFVSRKKSKEQLTDAQASPRFGKPHRPLPSPTQTARQCLQVVKGPITPPSETSGNQLTPASLQRQRSEDAAKSAAQLSSASSSKFKRNDIYDYPESDIDDSQMSPRSRQGQLSHKKSKDRLNRIESLKSPQNRRGEDPGLSISQAIDTLDDESVFGDDRPLEQSFRTPEDVSGKTSSRSVEETETSVYEDPDMGDDEEAEKTQDTASQKADSKASANSAHANGDTDTPSSKSATTPSKQHSVELKSQGKTAQIAKTTTLNPNPNPKQVKATPGGKETASTSKGSAARGRKRKRKQSSDTTSVDGDSRSSLNGSDSASVPITQSPVKVTKPAKKAKASRSTPSLDSAGEQLSQNLQDSTEKLALKVSNKKPINEHKKPQTTTPGKKDKQVVAEGSAKKNASKILNGKPSEQSEASTLPTKKVKKPRTAEQPSPPPPDIVVQRVEQGAGASPALPKPLPQWGSDTATIPAKGKYTAKDSKGTLDVDEHDDSRKSPSVGIGLTAEELKTMESRKNMTKEQYEAEKKRKQQEAKKQAKQVVTKKSQTTDKPATDKKTQAKEAQPEDPKPTTISTKSKVRKSLPSEGRSQVSLQRSATGSSVATSEDGGSKSSTKSLTGGNAKVVRRESTGASSSQASNAGSALPLRTPGKVIAKSPSVTSATTSKTAKPAQQKKAEATPAKAPTKSPSVTSATTKKTQKSTFQPESSSQQSKANKTPTAVTKKPAPAGSSTTKANSKAPGNPPAKTSQVTKPYKLTLGELHQTLRSGNNPPEVNKGGLLSQTKQIQKPVFVVEDDEEDEEASDSSEEEEEKPKVAAKAGNKVQIVVQKKQPLEDDDLDEEESSESESKKKKTSKDKQVPPKTTAQGKVAGRPDPSIRDKSISSDDEDEDEDDEL